MVSQTPRSAGCLLGKGAMKEDRALLGKGSPRGTGSAPSPSGHPVGCGEGRKPERKEKKQGVK